MAERITDTQRLNFLSGCHKSSAPQSWVGVCYDGMLIIDEPHEVDKNYDIQSNARPTIRAAIDAAIRAERRGRK